MKKNINSVMKEDIKYDSSENKPQKVASQACLS